MPVATEGVDFSVVSQHAEGVSEGPRGEGVCAVALMKNSERGFVGGVLKIQIETLQLGAREHSLVDDDTRAEGGDVERGSPIRGASVFNFVTG